MSHQLEYQHPLALWADTLQMCDSRFCRLISSNCLWCGKDIRNLEFRVLKDVTVQAIVSKQDIRVLLREKHLSFLKRTEDMSQAHGFGQLGSYSRSRSLVFWVVVVGLKGLLNLHETDSLNCVLQLFLHLPPILDFYFSDFHTQLVRFGDESHPRNVSCETELTAVWSVTASCAAYETSFSPYLQTILTNLWFPPNFCFTFGRFFVPMFAWRT